MSGLFGCAIAAAGVGWIGASTPRGGHADPPAGSPPQTGQAGWRFEGEYGLYAAFERRGLEVRWLTEEEGPGLVRAIVDGRVVDEQRTEAGHAHSARLRARASEVTLEYGAEGAKDLHRTRIRAEPRLAEIAFPARDSVFVFGDVHGEFDRVISLLARAGLVDAELRWTGGRSVVAFLGDLFDRGSDVTRLLWFVYRLEREAEAAGGRVITLLGNHEVMVLSGDLRYVAPKELTVADRHGMSYDALFDPARTILGRWLTARPALVRVGDLLLAHGGVSPTYADFSLEEYQDTLGAFIAEPLFTRWRDRAFLRRFERETRLDSAQVHRRYEFFFGAESVLWYRDLVLSDTLGDHLHAVLRGFGAGVHVVGHTPVRTIREGYGGGLIAVDLLDAAAEMLRLVRRPDGKWERARIGLDGEAHPLDALAEPDSG